MGLTILGIRHEQNTEETVSEEIVEAVMVPDTFKSYVKNKFDVPEEIMETIISYLDCYYESMYLLEMTDMEELFANELSYAISYDSIRLMIEQRKLLEDNFSLLDSSYYDIYITGYEYDDGIYEVDFIEDDTMYFSCLEEIESKAVNIENTICLELIDGQYKIVAYDKQQGYYQVFAEAKSTEEADALYEEYYEELKRLAEEDILLKSEALQNPYLSDKTYNHAYDRDSAIDYADKYYEDRNDEYNDFGDEGGNCQNYASQVIYAGGIEMDYEGRDQWKYYGYSLNDRNEKKGRSKSWVSVSDFYDYAIREEKEGVVCAADINIYYAEAGDVIQVGYDTYSHSTIVSAVVNQHILLNSNTVDLKNYPLEVYTCPLRRLIKILGYNS